jgi:hypothetical protein
VALNTRNKTIEILRVKLTPEIILRSKNAQSSINPAADLDPERNSSRTGNNPRNQNQNPGKRKRGEGNLWIQRTCFAVLPSAVLPAGDIKRRRRRAAGPCEETGSLTKGQPRADSAAPVLAPASTVSVTPADGSSQEASASGARRIHGTQTRGKRRSPLGGRADEGEGGRWCGRRTAGQTKGEEGESWFGEEAGWVSRARLVLISCVGGGCFLRVSFLGWRSGIWMPAGRETTCACRGFPRYPTTRPRAAVPSCFLAVAASSSCFGRMAQSPTTARGRSPSTVRDSHHRREVVLPPLIRTRCPPPPPSLLLGRPNRSSHINFLVFILLCQQNEFSSCTLYNSPLAALGPP